MPLSLQSKLLRVLQEHEVRRVGDSKVFTIDVRVISASNKNLFQLMNSGQFRPDLYYRLDVLDITIPPLRERSEDIEVLFHVLLSKQCSDNSRQIPVITENALSPLLNYRFPGNVRELVNIIERLLAITKAEIDIKDVKSVIRSEIPNIDVISKEAITLENENDELEEIKAALATCGGNQTKAAAMLGISRSTLWRKIRLSK